MDSSLPTGHKPSLADWMKVHTKNASIPPHLTNRPKKEN